MSDAADQARDLLANPPIGVEVWGPIVEGLLGELGRTKTGRRHDVEIAKMSWRDMATAAGVEWNDDNPSMVQDITETIACTRTDLAKARNDRQEFALAIGFASDHRPEGHGVWVPELVDMVDPINEALSSARDHDECPVICENCGERLADVVCEHCHGSGADNTLCANYGGYSECEWCAGAGKVHPGCVGKSYGDMAVEFGKLLSVIERVRGQLRDAVQVARNGTVGSPPCVDGVTEAEALEIMAGALVGAARVLEEAERGEGS